MQKHSILLVEDSKMVCRAVQKRIDRTESVSLDVAHSWQEAVELVEKKRKKYLAALLDLNLPDAPDGEIVEYIDLQEIPFVVFTGSQSVDMKSMCAKYEHMIDYVNKQSAFSLDYLIRLITRLIKNVNIQALIIDDSSFARKTMISKLSRTMLRTHEAGTATEALALLEKPHDYGLVLIDSSLPDMHGFELCKTIRDLPHNRDLCILGFAADGDNSVAPGFLKSGANDYVSKTCTLEEMLCRVMQNLDMQDFITTYRDASNRDYLTGLYNRRFLFESAGIIQAQASRNNTPFAVGVLDIDFFKRINDTMGHDTGDKVLKMVSSALTESIRKSDVLARIGGEEFCIVAVDCAQEEAGRLFEKVRASIEENVRFTHNEQPVTITTSVGACSDCSIPFEEMVKAADENLYQAKESGRNRVVIG